MVLSPLRPTSTQVCYTVMRNVLLYQLDGKIPNLALVRVAAHHAALGDRVEVRTTGHPKPELFCQPDIVYGSAIFTKSQPSVARLRAIYPNAIIGGTGVDATTTLESCGITTQQHNYSPWPSYPHSIGFTQRGCRLTCKFCVVPTKEGKVAAENTCAEIWRGDPYPRNLVLLDNDFFGPPDWRQRVQEIHDGGYKVCLMQGINVRFITEESAEALASMPCYDDNFRYKRIYTAWDNRGDEERVVRGLEMLFRCGIPPSRMMIYMLIGYWPSETEDDWVYRERRLRELGCMAYPMPFVRTPATVGFQRFVVTHYSKSMPWEQFKAAGYHSPYQGQDMGQQTLLE